jgi:hypothetical protein
MHSRHSTRSLLFVLLMLAVPAVSHAGIILSIGIAPPPLPVYDQPLCPAEGYIWTPGYWAYDSDDGYFWVPGTWVLVPEPGFLWTPGYWGWSNGVFVFNQGYWGPQVGFYGGINYGFGYVGSGYAGGYWNNGAFFYNRSVNNVGSVRNVYNKTVIVNNITVNHVSYNGGEGGISARPTAQEEAAAHDRHIAPTSVQASHVQAASSNRQLYESQNHGRPAIAATAKPGEFSGHNIVAAKAAAPSYKPATARTGGGTGGNNAGSSPNTPTHAKDIAPSRAPAPNTGKPALDQKYQQQQNALNAKQDKERQSLQKAQEQDHQRLAQRKAPQQAEQQVEQKHQQQTQQLQQKHTVEQQKLQEKQRPAPASRPEANSKEKK